MTCACKLNKLKKRAGEPDPPGLSGAPAGAASDVPITSIEYSDTPTMSILHFDLTPPLACLGKHVPAPMVIVNGRAYQGRFDVLQQGGQTAVVTVAGERLDAKTMSFPELAALPACHRFDAGAPARPPPVGADGRVSWYNTASKSYEAKGASSPVSLFQPPPPPPPPATPPIVPFAAHQQAQQVQQVHPPLPPLPVLPPLAEPPLPPPNSSCLDINACLQAQRDFVSSLQAHKLKMQDQQAQAPETASAVPRCGGGRTYNLLMSLGVCVLVGIVLGCVGATLYKKKAGRSRRR